MAEGQGKDRRIKAMVTDPDWIAEAREKRIFPINFTDMQLTGLIVEAGESNVVILFAAPGETIPNFLIGVDFAWDIIEQILTDPYDGMVVADKDDVVRFMSPLHEHSLNLAPGEGVGRKARDVIPGSRLRNVVSTGVAEVGQILEVDGRQRIVSRHPIRHEGEIVGAIGRVMFKGTQQLDEMSSRIHELEAKVARYEAEAQEETRGERYLEAIVGQSSAIEMVRVQIRKIAPLDVPVLIQGESGTGKELVARALHMLSPRRNGRLVTVNAAALPATLVESELFGYEPGSFTGADRKGRKGKFEQADKGTLFLDEIGDMPLEVQAKLLRVLQDRVVERVGGERAKSVDFRLCSATNHDLEQLVEKGDFRLDLFYRISPVVIQLPPLSERLEDIPLLLHHFLKELSDKYGRPMPEVDINVPDMLMGRKWPGNIRQLRHEIERAFVFADSGVLQADNFAMGGMAGQAATSMEAVRMAMPALAQRPAAPGPNGVVTIKDAVDQLERDLIADALARFKGNKKKVADQLGVSRSYLYKKLGEMEEADAGAD